MRIYLILLLCFFFKTDISAQQFKWMGGVGVLNSKMSNNSDVILTQSGINLFISSNESPQLSLETYFEYKFSKILSARTGLNYWRFRTFNTVNNILSSSSFFSSSESDINNWSVPLSLHYNIRKLQIFYGLQQNFIMSNKTKQNSFNFNSNTETDNFVKNASQFYKKSYFTNFIGVNYQYKFAVVELKFYASLKEIAKANNLVNHTQLSGINLSLFLQFDLNEN
jgi:hypothetical protein